MIADAHFGTQSEFIAIAEACGRIGNAELHRFLQIASGSASELDYHWLLSHDLGFLSDPECQEVERMTTEVRRMLTSLVQRVNSDRVADR